VEAHHARRVALPVGRLVQSVALVVPEAGARAERPDGEGAVAAAVASGADLIGPSGSGEVADT